MPVTHGVAGSSPVQTAKSTQFWVLLLFKVVFEHSERGRISMFWHIIADFLLPVLLPAFFDILELGLLLKQINNYQNESKVQSII
jgi:hypothetical protein